jgi:hypothetical protein
MMGKKFTILLAVLIAGILSACSTGSVPGKALSELVGSGYKGKLLLIELAGNTNKLEELDLGSDKLNDLFQVPENGWLTGARFSPDGQQIVLAYAPPPPGGNSLYYITIPTFSSCRQTPLPHRKRC